jgi:C1A family cysteine protease
MFKLSFVIALVASSAFASTFNLRSYDVAHFLEEKDTLKAELLAWKQSTAGQTALSHGYYKEDKHTNADEVSEDQLQRFFMTKLGIEKAQAANPYATFSTDTPFSLMTNDEFKAFVGKSFQLGNSHKDEALTPEEEQVLENKPMAASKDWTKGNCVSDVKNQGKCGSCWAFSSVGALESANCLNTGEMTLFSEQEVNSCDTSSYGCEGGFPLNGLRYIQKKKGICTAESYPYVSGSSEQTTECSDSCTRADVQVKKVVSVPSSEQGFLKSLNTQPIAVAVAAGNDVWKQYKGGVVSSCPSTQLDHAVIAVGYGETKSTPNFKIKNSWSTSWGEEGYIYLKRDACGVINTHAVYPML